MNKFLTRFRRPGLILLLAVCLLLTQTQSSRAFLEGLTIEKERQIGEEFLLEVQQEYSLIDDPFLTSYVNRLGQQLVAGMGPQPFRYKFFIIEDPTMNSFAVPGGYVFLNTGMITLADRKEELAGVMAHEISHIYCRHMAQMVEKSRVITAASVLGVLASVFLGGALAPPLLVGAMGGGESAMLSYSRDFEGQADAMGFKWMLKAGLNPRGMVSMFNKMNKQRWFEGGKVPLYLRTHPYTEDRIVVLTQKLQMHQNELPPYKDFPDFQYFTSKLASVVGNPNQLLRQATEDALHEPQNALFPFTRALALAKLERTSEATAAFQQALKLDPGNSIIKRELAIFYFHRNRLNEANQLLEELTRRAPQDDVTLYYLGRICQERKQIDQALTLFEKVHQLNPGFAQVLYNLGILYGEKGQLGPAHYYLGLYSLRSRALPSALFHFHLALKNLSPADARYAQVQEQVMRLRDMKVRGE